LRRKDNQFSVYCFQFIAQFVQFFKVKWPRFGRTANSKPKTENFMLLLRLIYAANTTDISIIVPTKECGHHHAPET
jgi:hypothetical protein